MSWLFPFSLHTTTGFFELILCIYAFYGLRNFWKRSNHLADCGRIGIILYAITNSTGAMSPATDYGTMFLTLYAVTAWLENMETEKDTTRYALLSVMTVFLATMKLSCAVFALLVCYPAVCLLRRKKWKEIVVHILLGMVVLAPFLIRNVWITGWFLYPFEGIDLFQVEWKIPLQYLLVDAAQIKVWGRCLFDITLVDMPFREWFPIWWEAQEHYGQMLFYANILGMLFGVVNLVQGIWSKRKIRMELVVMYAAMIASFLFWLFTAAFIRYGLAFLLVLPLLGIGTWMERNRKGLYSIVAGGLVLLIAACYCPYVDNYMMDLGVFIKHNIREPYYIFQKEYDESETGVYELNGNAVYYSEQGIVNSYYNCPSTCYEDMLLRSELMGDKIEDGFQAK